MISRKISVGLLVGALLVIAVVLTLFMQGRGASNTNESNANQSTNQSTNAASNLNLNPTRELTEEEIQRNEVQRIAGIFAERYGTYNGEFSQSDLENTADLISASFLASLQKSAPATPDNASITFTTTVLSKNIASFVLGSSAIVEVATMRLQTNINDGTSHTASQNLTVKLVYQNEEWKADSAQWMAPLDIDTQ